MGCIAAIRVAARPCPPAGALRIGSDFLAAHHQGPKAVYLSEPSWGIHPGIFAASGHAIRRYRYYQAATRQLDYEVRAAHPTPHPLPACVLHAGRQGGCAGQRVAWRAAAWQAGQLGSRTRG
jgi:aspartate/tyrosine/aromatic aminotransferase